MIISRDLQRHHTTHVVLFDVLLLSSEMDDKKQGDLGVITKASIRQKIWDHLEKNNLANFPRPVHHRIPNVKGAAAAAEKLKELDVFHKARTIKVNPDKPQEHARFLTLEAHKTLLVPTPRLRTGLFNRIIPPPNPTKEQLRKCATSQGVRQFSVPVGLDDHITVDLVIIGSVAVSPKGYRIGKGEGFADMEYAMMVAMGAVSIDTIVISTVHDCQVLDDMPDDLMGPHDLMVDYILTPTRIIHCGSQRKNGHITKPAGILWQTLSRDKFNQIPILKTLRQREQKAGKDVRLKDEKELPELEDERTKVRRVKGQLNQDKQGVTDHEVNEDVERNTPSSKPKKGSSNKSGFNDRAPSRGVYSQSHKSSSQKSSASKSPVQNKSVVSNNRVFVGGLPRALRVKEFKETLCKTGVEARYMAWHGGRGFAFITLAENENAQNVVEKLNGMSIREKAIRAEIAHGSDGVKNE